MESLQHRANSFSFSGNSGIRELENKSQEELHQDLEHLQELDEKLNPEKKAAFNGKDVALSVFGGLFLSSGVGFGLSSAGVTFTLANPIAGLVVLATALTGTYISGVMTDSRKKVRAYKDWQVQVVQPRYHLMRALNKNRVQDKNQEAGFEQPAERMRPLEERKTVFIDTGNKSFEKLSIPQAQPGTEDEQNHSKGLEERLKQQIEMLQNENGALQAELEMFKARNGADALPPGQNNQASPSGQKSISAPPPPPPPPPAPAPPPPPPLRPTPPSVAGLVREGRTKTVTAEQGEVSSKKIDPQQELMNQFKNGGFKLKKVEKSDAKVNPRDELMKQIKSQSLKLKKVRKSDAEKEKDNENSEDLREIKSVKPKKVEPKQNKGNSKKDNVDLNTSIFDSMYDRIAERRGGMRLDDSLSSYDGDSGEWSSGDFSTPEHNNAPQKRTGSTGDNPGSDNQNADNQSDGA